MQNKLLIGDGEVNERPGYRGGNLFEMTLSGSLVGTLSTLAFSDEPTGVAFNLGNGHLFTSDDDRDRIFEVNPGADGLYNTADDIVTSFSTAAFNSYDPEDVTFADIGQGTLFIADGSGSEVYQVTPGANGVFDGVPPVGDDQVTSFDTASLGITDPEGIAFESNSGHLFIVGRPSNLMGHVTTAGTLVRMVDISVASLIKPAGLAYAPGIFNPTQMSVYICDRGTDNNRYPGENDGKIYEMLIPTLPPGTGIPAPTPTSTSTPTPTSTSTSTPTLTPTSGSTVTPTSTSMSTPTPAPTVTPSITPSPTRPVSGPPSSLRHYLPLVIR